MSFTPEFATIAALRLALQNKTVSARELAQQALDSSARQKELNAFVLQDAALTLAQADAADEPVAEVEQPQLLGRDAETTDEQARGEAHRRQEHRLVLFLALPFYRPGKVSQIVQARRLPGLTPGALSTLLAFLSTQQKTA